MKSLLLVVIVSLSIPSFANVYVNGYTRSNGTYVAPYVRTSPNQNFNDNWPTKSNTNPYTGQVGTKVNQENMGNSNLRYYNPTNRNGQ